MAIVDKIDKLSGTNVRSKNIEDAVGKLQSDYTHFDISGSDFGGYNTSISQSEIYETAVNGNGYRLVPWASSDGIELKFAGYDYEKQVTKFIGWKFGYWEGTTIRDIDCILYTIPANGSITRKYITMHEEPNPNA